MAQAPYSPVPDVAPTVSGTGAQYQSAEATPNAFGAQIGQAVSGVGEQIQKQADHFLNIFNESSARDATSKAASAIADENNKFFQLKGNDAVAGLKQHEATIDQIVKDNSEGLSFAANPMYLGQVSGYADRAKITAGSHAGQQADIGLKSSMDGTIQSNQNLFAMNPNDPSSEDHIHEIVNSTLSLSHLNGFDKNAAEALTSHNIGTALIAGVHSNMQTNPDAANKLTDRALNGSYVMPDGTRIPMLSAEQREQLLTFTRSENQKYTDVNNLNALLAGNPLPPPVGGGVKEVNVKSAVAASAQKAGNDPNVALMIAGLESSFGRTSDNIGGVKGSGAMEQKQAEAERIAKGIFGGEATPAQIYTVYQQGPGGGAAILKTAQTNPNASALDVLTPLYKSQEEAASALTGNRIPVNATVKQVTDFLQKKCDSMYGSVKCNTTTPDGSQVDLGKAIVQPHVQAGVPAQPTSNPIEAMQQFNELYSSRMAVINDPNNGLSDLARKNLEEGFKAKTVEMKAEETAYKEAKLGEINKITSQPDFVSYNDSRITPDMRAFMSQDEGAMKHVQNMAEFNRNLAKGTGDANNYGEKSWEVSTKIQSGEITNLSQLNEYAHQGGLTSSGLRQARQEFTDISKEKQEAYKRLADTIVPDGNKKVQNDILSQYKPQIDAEIKERQSRQVPQSDYFDPENKEWIGKGIKPMSAVDVLKANIGIDPKTNKLSSDTTADIVKQIDDINKHSQQTIEQIKSGLDNANLSDADKAVISQKIDGLSGDASSVVKANSNRTIQDVMFDYSRETDPSKKMALKEEAKRLGWTPKARPPEVPLANGQ